MLFIQQEESHHKEGIMSRYGKGLVVILASVGMAFSGIAFAVEVGGIDFSGFGDQRQAGSQAGGADASRFGPPPSLDTNNDGMVSRDEFPGPDTHFYELDQNSDGYIDQGEAPEGPPPRGGDQIGDTGFPAFGPPPPVDADNDGLISQEEFPGPDGHFTELDQNGDGYIDKDEAPKGPPEGGCPDGEFSGERPEGPPPWAAE